MTVDRALHNRPELNETKWNRSHRQIRLPGIGHI